MSNALILHGKPTRARYENPDLPKPHEANWLPGVAAFLMERGIPTDVPAFPEPYAPDYEKWRIVLERYRIDSETTVVAHSAGGNLILRWLTENPARRLGHLVLVAPWSDSKRKYGEFSNFTPDPGIARRVGRFTIFNSLDDDLGVQETVAGYMQIFGNSVNLRELNGYGHFMMGNKMTTTDFPELREELATTCRVDEEPEQ